MDILIVQMGKVASTAIAEALRRKHLQVLQAHIASSDRLHVKLKTMLGPVVSDEVANRMYEDYLQELRVTFLLARQRIRQDNGGRAVRVITLARDPLSWYWSHFAQNYDHYDRMLRKYFLGHGGRLADFDPEQVFLDVQKKVFYVLENTHAPLDEAGALKQLMGEAKTEDPTGVVFGQINRFLVPLRWFDEDFLPATGIDVYSSKFDKTHGCAVIASAGLSVLLLRYEDLSQLAPKIAQFVDVSGISLQRANISLDKNLPFDIKQMQARAWRLIPPNLVSRIYATRYARHFGYSRDSVASV